MIEIARRQHRCLGREDLLAIGFSEKMIAYELATGRFVALHQGVYAVAPVFLEDRKTSWMAATLTAPDSFLALASAGAAYEIRPFKASFEMVVRPGSGGPEIYDGLRVSRSETLDGNTTLLDGIPIMTVERTIIDLSASMNGKALRRMVREALRVERTTIPSLVDVLARHKGRRGTRAVQLALATYSGLPIERCRSGSEVQALVVLREAGEELPEVNRKVAGEEADLLWRRRRHIVEIDGGPFHLDRGEDERKELVWSEAGYTVDRIPSEAVWNAPHLLLALAERR